MPTLTFQWKDPDWFDGEDLFDTLTDDQYRAMRDAGLEEYLVVEYDTDTRQATVRRPRPRPQP